MICNTCSGISNINSDWACNTSASLGHLDCLRYLNENGYKWYDSLAFDSALRGDFVNCLQYMCEHNDINYIFDENACAAAAYSGSINCLRYLHETVNCPWNERTCSEAASSLRKFNFELKGEMKDLFKEKDKDIKCLKYAHENVLTSEEVSANEARGLHSCPWDEQTCIKAAEGGNIGFLVYAHEQKCPWNERVCEAAATMGKLDCLIYAHEQGCPWDNGTCSSAASYGFLDCLEYAHKNGLTSSEVAENEAKGLCSCPWDGMKCFVLKFPDKFASMSYLMDTSPEVLICFRYAIDNGCKIDKEMFEIMDIITEKAEKVRNAVEKYYGRDIGNIIIDMNRGYG
jgi:hypothetical protein